MKPQRAYYEESQRKLAEANETFVFEILPTLTMDEFEKLCLKRPELYERYRGIATATINARTNENSL